MTQRQQFSSEMATIMTMTGTAIGLGNVWRFPYMMGSNGGSAFLLCFLVFMFFFAIPAVIAEWSLGRESRGGPIKAFSYAVGPVLGRIIGYILIFVVMVAVSYYMVVIANVFFSSFFSTVYGFTNDNIPTYNRLLADGAVQYGVGLALLVSALFIVHKGLNNGIEVVSKIFVPFFFVVILYLIYSALTLEGSLTHLKAFLQPDFSLLGPKEIFAAMGQAFFSIGLGGTYILIYGSYMDQKTNLPRSALYTATGDISAALLAALFIIPTILVFGLDMSSGPHLIFVTMPHLFNQMPNGQLLGSLFLISLGMVAYLSAIAAFEVLAGGLIDDDEHVKLSKGKLIIIIGIVEALLMIPSSFKPEIIGTLDLFFGSGMQVLGSCLALLALTWGIGRKRTLMQIFRRSEGLFPRLFFVWIQWVVPAALLLVLGGFLFDMITGD